MNALLSNPFKRGLLRGETQIGLWLSSTSSYMAEIAATSGYDWLLIDGEHAPNDLRSTLGALQAVASHPAQPVVRSPAAAGNATVTQHVNVTVNTQPGADANAVGQAAASATQKMMQQSTRDTRAALHDRD